MNKTLVLGIGNLLLSDEGVGIHAIRRLEERVDLPSDVETIDGGTLGLHILPFLDGVTRLIVIDAILTNTKPGSLKRLTGDEVPIYLEQKGSPHDIGLPTLLSTAKLCGSYPEEVVVWGIQPENIGIGIELSTVIEARLDMLVDKVYKEVTGQ